MRPQPSAFPQTRRDLISLRGGLDLVTPTLDLKPGVLRESLNYEINTTGGYTRVAGYERYDGRARPSEAAFFGLTLSSVAGASVGNTVNGLTSGAVAVIIAVNGSTLVCTRQSGTFMLAETVRVGVTPIGSLLAFSPGATDPRSLAQYGNLAADAYRADIGPVPGSGPIRGVAFYKNQLYAWRNNAGGSALGMFVESPSGWAPIAPGFTLPFTTGLAAGIVDGNTVTGLTSGAVGIVTRVVVRSGDFSTNDAAGILALGATVGVFAAGEALRVSGTTRATSGGAASAITLLPNGRVYTDQGAISGGEGIKLYIADGVNQGFEFDGSTLVPIATGMSPDRPLGAKVHQRHLFFSFGNSIQHSGLGEAYRWTAVFGAAELTINGDWTDWVQMPGAQTTGALVIYTRNTTHVLYGTDSSDWNLVTFQRETGAYAYTAQTMSSAFALDDRGVLELAAAQEYGNFADASLTSSIVPFLQPRRSRATASSINREKNQVRVFFNDGYALYVTLVNGKLRGSMPVQFSNPVTVACNGETGDGAETNFFGSTNGFVYRLDAGTSFDGDLIPATALLVFSNQRALRVNKRYRRGTLEITGSSFAEVQIGYNLAYGDSMRADQSSNVPYANNFQAPYWDSFTWDAFVWDGLSLAPIEFFLDGTAENIALRVDSNSDYFAPYTLNTLTLEYTLRQGLRYAE